MYVRSTCALVVASTFVTACSSSGGDAATNDDAGVDTTTTADVAETSVDDVGDADASSDTGDAPDLHDVFPAFRPPVPQTASRGGPTLSDFTVVPVIYAGDSDGASVPDYLAKYAASPELAAQLADYGVGTMTVGTTVTLAGPAPTTIADADLRTWLIGQLDGTHPEWGPTDAATLAKTIYVVVYPTGTAVTDRSGGKSCAAFEGYHDAVPVPATDAGTTSSILYAAIPRCSATGLTAAQVLTLTVGHEILEAATDPFATSKPAYHALDTDHLVWGGSLGSEIADLCSYEPFFWAPPDIGYTIARSWSNKAAKAYEDPCVPAPPGEPYFNSFVPATDVVSFGTAKTKGILAPVGVATTFDVDLFSAAATSGPWTVFVNERALGADPKVLTIALDASTGTNGDTLHLTLTPKSATPSGHTTLQIVSKLGTQQSLWWVLVGVK
jgi:hypothetical protein